jgi:hypothetical protein
VKVETKIEYREKVVTKVEYRDKLRNKERIIEKKTASGEVLRIIEREQERDITQQQTDERERVEQISQTVVKPLPEKNRFILGLHTSPKLDILGVGLGVRLLDTPIYGRAGVSVDPRAPLKQLPSITLGVDIEL